MTRPAGPAVGLDVGGTKCLAVAVDGDGQLLDELRVDTPRGAGALLAALESAVGTLGERVGSPAAVGVGVPGLVDRAGRLRVAPNLPGIDDLAVGERLAGTLGVPVAVDNDATCAAWAEHRLGAARGATDAVLVTLGTGIGAGVVAAGGLVRGAHGFAGEAGHMVVDPDGPPCPCGRNGCWERYASGSGLGRLARDAAAAGQLAGVVAAVGGDPEDVKGEHVTRAALAGDPQALAVVDQLAWWLGLGIANLVNLLDPDVVVVGGGLAAGAGETLLEPARRAYRAIVLGADERATVRIVGAELGERAGALGAALLASDLAGAGTAGEVPDGGTGPGGDQSPG